MYLQMKSLRSSFASLKVLLPFLVEYKSLYYKARKVKFCYFRFLGATHISTKVDLDRSLRTFLEFDTK